MDNSKNKKATKKVADWPKRFNVKRNFTYKGKRYFADSKMKVSLNEAEATNFKNNHLI